MHGPRARTPRNRERRPFMFEGKAAFQSAFWGWGTRIAFALAIFATWTFPAPGLAVPNQSLFGSNPVSL